jgi:hypothetical protein
MSGGRTAGRAASCGGNFRRWKRRVRLFSAAGSGTSGCFPPLEAARPAVLAARPAVFLLVVFFSAFLRAAMITDPATGTDIDPAGAETVDGNASNAADMATLEALADVQVLGNWAGFTGGTDGVTFTDPALPDLRITTSFASIYTNGNDTSATYQTSAGGENFAWSGSSGQTVTIEFGTWDGGSFTPGAGVRAAGMTLLNFGGAYPQVTVTYFDAADQVLSAQTFAGGGPDTTTTGGNDFWSGHVEAGYVIARVVIALNRDAGSSDVAMDDLTFTHTEPMPGTLRFRSASRVLPLDGGPYALSVARVGGAAGEVSVAYSTLDGTALAGVDYAAAAGTLIWADGDTADKSIPITLPGDPDSPGKAFQVELSSPGGGAALGSPDTMDLTIAAAVGDNLATDLVAYLPMEGADAELEDASFYELDLALGLEGTVRALSGSAGEARRFDGVDDRITVAPWASGDVMPDREAVSVSLWFNADTTAGQRVLFDDPAAWDGLAARISNGVLQATCQRNGKRVTLQTAFTQTGSWHHLLVVKDGDGFVMYLNGNPAGSVADLNAASASSVNAGIGDAFDGLIDELRVYRRALSPEEAAGLQSAPPLEAGAVWRGFYFDSTANSGAAADGADADADGAANLWERASGTNPTAVLEVSFPEAVRVEEAGAVYLAVRYRRRSGGTGTTGVDYSQDGITWRVETRPDLLTGDWAGGAGVVEAVGTAVDHGDGTEMVIVRRWLNADEEPVSFLRVAVD